MSDIKKIPTRSEIAVEDTWAIEDLFATDEAWEQELSTLEADKQALSAYAGRLGNRAKELYEYLYISEQGSV